MNVWTGREPVRKSCSSAPAPADLFDQYGEVTGTEPEDNLECARRGAASDAEACKSMFSCDMLAGLLNDCAGDEYHPSAPRLRSGPSAEETEQVPGDGGSYDADSNADEADTFNDAGTSDETGYYETDEGTAGARDANFVSSPSWEDGSWGEDSGQSGEDGEEEFTEVEGNCNDGVDNDMDSWTDNIAGKIDPDCVGKREQLANPNSCSNGVDDNGNGSVDWLDPACGIESSVDDAPAGVSE